MENGRVSDTVMSDDLIGNIASKALPIHNYLYCIAFVCVGHFFFVVVGF